MIACNLELNQIDEGVSSIVILTGDKCCTLGQLSLRQFVPLATALVCEGIESETSLSLQTWPTAKQSPN